VQRHAARAWEEETSFRELVEGDGEITGTLDRATLAEVFSLDPYTRHVDTVFERLRSLVRKEESVHA
jgi:adenylosuccinate lyase